MRIVWSLIIILVFAALAVCQQGPAGNGRYPPGYKHRQTWVGYVTTVDEVKREVTLNFREGDHEETFKGIFVKNYWGPFDANGKDIVPDLSALMGRQVKASYSPLTKTDAKGDKITINRIYSIEVLRRIP
jgi:hypothetical protein